MKILTVLQHCSRSSWIKDDGVKLPQDLPEYVYIGCRRKRWTLLPSRMNNSVHFLHRVHTLGTVIKFRPFWAFYD